MPQFGAPDAEPDCWYPDWPAPANVKALMTTRLGGVSEPPCDSFNLGDHVHDHPAHVAANRLKLAHLLGAHPVFLQQVHGVRCEMLNSATSPGITADASWSREPGVACTVMVADCLPVLLTDMAGTWVAAVHAGWRGLAGVGQPGGEGVLEEIFKTFNVSTLDNIDCKATKKCVTQQPWKTPEAADLLAWLGPCIGPEVFEVGEEVREAFTSVDPAANACFQPVAGHTGKFLANLAGLARQRLHRLGVTRIHGNDGSAAWCTVSNPSVWFSHRRDARLLGTTGRMAACVWLV